MSNRRGSVQILQMVMMGCFDYAKAPDSLDERVLSAVLPQLKAIQAEDFAHFCAEFSVEAPVIRSNYYIALAKCLLADIHLNPDPGGDATLVHRILPLFLEPHSEEDAPKQMADIRSQMTDELLERMAQELGIPKDFIKDLIGYDASAAARTTNRGSIPIDQQSVIAL